MAEPHAETVGAVTDAHPHAKEAPVAQKDVVKENGELPASESLAEIVGKKKEDSMLNGSPSAPEVTAPVENGGEYTIPKEEDKGDGTIDTEAAPFADAPSTKEDKIPVSSGEKGAKVEAKPQSANIAEPEPFDRVAEEDMSKPLGSAHTEEPKTELAEGVDISKTDEPKRQAGKAEAPKSPETEEKAVAVYEEETHKPEGKADDATEVAGAAVPRAVNVTETDQLSAAELPAGAIPKTVDTTEKKAMGPQSTEDSASKPSEANEPKAEPVVVNGSRQDAVDSTFNEEPHAEVTSKEKDSAADAGEPIPTEEKEADEPKNAHEATHEVRTPEEQHPAEAEESPKSPSFWGVVLKHVEPFVKSPLESQPKEEDGTGATSANSEDSNDVHKSLEKAHKQEPRAFPPADIAGQEITSRNAAATDVRPEKDREVGVEEAPKETEGRSTSKEVSPEALEEVSGRAQPRENATTETPEPMEQGIADDSPKEAELPSSEVKEKAFPAVTSEMSKEFPESASEETMPELSERTAESTEEPGEISSLTAPEQGPIRAGQETTEHLPQETYKEAKTEEESSLPVKEDAVDEKEAEDGISALETQPSLSVYIPKQGEPAAAGEEDTAEETTPRGSPLMQRVEQLEQKLAQHESRQSPRVDFTSRGHPTPTSTIDRPIRHSARHVLEETGSKGTLLDRVTALEEKLAYYLNVHHTSPSNGQATPTVAEDLASQPDSEAAESQTRDWSPSAAEGDNTPGQVHEEASKAAQDPIKPTTEEKSPEDLPAQTEGMAPSRNTSSNEKKVKAKAAVGHMKGFITGCFSPKREDAGGKMDKRILHEGLNMKLEEILKDPNDDSN